MSIGRKLSLAIAAASALALAGCSSYGGGRGYGGVSIGTADGYYDRGGYGNGYGNGYYGDPYYGWYDNYYYPGTGYYVYNRAGKRYAWNGAQQRYWQARRAAWRGQYHARENWSGYRDQRRDGWRDRRGDYRDQRRDYRERREDYRERREDYRERRRERREDYRERSGRNDGPQVERRGAAAREPGPMVERRQSRPVAVRPAGPTPSERRDPQPITQPE